jgi:hypothetical protein
MSCSSGLPVSDGRRFHWCAVMKRPHEDRPNGAVRRYVLAQLKGMGCWCEVSEIAAAAEVSEEVARACLESYEGEYARRCGSLWRFETCCLRKITLN